MSLLELTSQDYVPSTLEMELQELALTADDLWPRLGPVYSSSPCSFLSVLEYLMCATVCYSGITGKSRLEFSGQTFSFINVLMVTT